MSKGQLVITAVVVEGRSKSEVARDYDVSRQWVQQLCRRYAAEGRDGVRTALTTPHTSARAVRPGAEDRILRLRKNLTKRGFDAAPNPSPPPTSPQTHHQRACGIHHRAHPDR